MPLAGSRSMITLQVPQVRRVRAREPRQNRAGSSAKRSSVSLREAWGIYILL